MSKRTREGDESAVMVGRLLHQRWRIMRLERERILQTGEGPVRFERLAYLLGLGDRQIRRWRNEGKIATVEGHWPHSDTGEPIPMPLVPHSEVLRLLDEQIEFLEIDGHCRVFPDGANWWNGYRTVSAAKAARLLHGYAVDDQARSRRA